MPHPFATDRPRAHYRGGDGETRRARQGHDGRAYRQAARRGDAARRRSSTERALGWSPARPPESTAWPVTQPFARYHPPGKPAEVVVVRRRSCDFWCRPDRDRAGDNCAAAGIHGDFRHRAAHRLPPGQCVHLIRVDNAGRARRSAADGKYQPRSHLDRIDRFQQDGTWRSPRIRSSMAGTCCPMPSSTASRSASIVASRRSRG